MLFFCLFVLAFFRGEGGGEGRGTGGGCILFFNTVHDKNIRNNKDIETNKYLGEALTIRKCRRNILHVFFF